MESVFEVLDSDVGTWWEMTTPWLWHLLSTDALSKDRWFLDSVFPRRVLCCHSGKDNEKSVYNIKALLNKMYSSRISKLLHDVKILTISTVEREKKYEVDIRKSEEKNALKATVMRNNNKQTLVTCSNQ